MENVRQAQKAATRKAILLAAARQFASRGYAGTSFATIAHEMGRPKSAIGYHQFATKNELANTILDTQYGQWHTLRDGGQMLPRGAGRLFSLMLTLAIDVLANPLAAAACRLLVEAEDAGLTVPTSGFSWRAIAAEEIQYEIERGRFPQATDVRSVVDQILLITLGTWTATRYGIREFSTEERLTRAWRDLLLGIGVDDPASIIDQIEIIHLPSPLDDASAQ